jgi:hypothetical protein
MKDQTGSQLPQLDLIHTKEAMEEFVSRKRKTSIQEGEEHHSKTGRGIGP